MAASKAHYLQLLRDQMGLFQQLADIRKEKNDLHDAKMRAWDQHRPQLSSNRAFEEFWELAKPKGIDAYHWQREREILAEIAKMKAVLEHLQFAGLADSDGADAAVEMPAPPPPTDGSPGWRWLALIGRSAIST